MLKFQIFLKLTQRWIDHALTGPYWGNQTKETEISEIQEMSESNWESLLVDQQ